MSPRPVRIECTDGRELLFNDLAWGYFGGPMTLTARDDPSKMPEAEVDACLAPTSRRHHHDHPRGRGRLTPRPGSPAGAGSAAGVGGRWRQVAAERVDDLRQQPTEVLVDRVRGREGSSSASAGSSSSTSSRVPSTSRSEFSVLIHAREARVVELAAVERPLDGVEGRQAVLEQLVAGEHLVAGVPLGVVGVGRAGTGAAPTGRRSRPGAARGAGRRGRP